MIGTYHHISEQHLDRYLAEFDFRYNNRSGLGIEDGERAAKALKIESAGAAASFKRNFDARFATGEALSAGSR